MLTVSQMAAALGLVGTVAASTVAIEARYAHESDVEKIEYRLDQKILQDRLAALQARLWSLQDRYGPDCGPARAACRQLLVDIEHVKRRLRAR